ncbi:MAG: choice-of-anchor D domain-containing protein [Candidatus Acidiferrales bacterium]
MGKKFLFAVWLGVFSIASSFYLHLQIPAIPLTRARPPESQLSLAQSRSRAASQFAAMPLVFEPSSSESPASRGLMARGRGYNLFLDPRQVIFELPTASNGGVPARREFVQMRFLGAQHDPDLSGEGVLPGRTNYLLGNDSRRWRIGVSHFERAAYSGLYPGIAAEFYGRGDEIEHDLVIEPGAYPDAIRFDFSVSRHARGQRTRVFPRITSAGELRIGPSRAQIILRPPQAYQESGAARRLIPVRFRLRPSGQVGFSLGAYDHTRRLIIDPSISVTYSTFAGGAGADSVNSVVLDSQENAYISGTTSQIFSEPQDTATNLGPASGASVLFIAKINPSVSGPASLVYLTFIGGSGNEKGGFVAFDPKVDSAKGGAPVLAGISTSKDFPTANCPGQTKLNGSSDLTVSALNAAGNAFTFSCYFGGSGAEGTQNAAGIAVDASGNIYVASDTTSTDLPLALGVNPFSSKNGGGASDGFFAQFSNAGDLLYSTYLGIKATVGCTGIAVDAQTPPNAYLTGFTSVPTGNSFPTKNAFQINYGGGPFDAFVMKISPRSLGANDLIYASFLGGSATDQAFAIAVDAASPPSAYISGSTNSPDFQTSMGTNAAFQSVLNGAENAFLSVVSETVSGGAISTSLFYSTYLGGAKSDSAAAIDVVSPSQVFIAGKATSANFPVFLTLQSFTGTSDAFAAQFDTTLSGQSSLIFSTLLGGSADAFANSVAADSQGNVFVAGATTSSDFLGGLVSPAATGFQPTCSSCSAKPPQSDAFLTRIAASSAQTPAVSFSPNPLDFGGQPVGQSVSSDSLVKNVGSADLVISSVTITGSNSPDFSLSTDTCAGQTIPAGKTCTLGVTFNPTKAANEIAAAEVFDNAPGASQSLPLSGVGTEPIAGLSPMMINFGNQPQNTPSNPQTVTLTNSGNSPLHISDLNLCVGKASGCDTADFSFSSSNCTASGAIPPQSSCAINVTFSPLSTGTFNSELDVLDDSGNHQNSQQTVTFTGTGTPPAPILTISPSMLSFGSQVVGSTAGNQSVDVRNSGSMGLQIASVGLTGANPADFNVITATSLPCPIGSGSLAPKSDCMLAVNFAPQSKGSKQAAVAIADNASGSPQLVALSGMATAPVAGLAPQSLTFASQNVGTSSAAQTVTLSNTGDGPLTIASISFTGAASADFNQTNSCPVTLNPNLTCIISVTFKPVSTGARAANLSVADNSAGTPQTASLAGTATEPMVVFSPTSINFAAQLAQTASPATPVMVSNQGNGPLDISGISFAGADHADFSETDTCKSPVAPGANCSVSVTFTPAGAGSRNASLQLADDAPATPQSVPLTGMASDFSISNPSGSAISATITAGQTATYNLQLNSLGGFAGSVSLSCSGAPFESSCTPSPAMLPLSAASANFMVSAPTTARSASFPRERTRPFISPFILFSFALITFLAYARLRALHVPHAKARAFLPAFALLLLLGLAACGSTGGGGGGNSGTPPGSYPLTVTASAQGTSRTFALSLTVQ